MVPSGLKLFPNLDPNQTTQWLIRDGIRNYEGLDPKQLRVTNSWNFDINKHCGDREV